MNNLTYRIILVLAFVASISFGQTCTTNNLRVFLNDTDTTGTNIRSTPGGEVLTSIKNNPKEELYIMFRVCKMEGNWLLITTLNNEKDITGWIHHSVVTANVTAYGDSIPIYASKTKDELVDTITNHQQVVILASEGDVSKIRKTDDKGVLSTGYIENQNLCGNPYTTCN